MTTAETVLDRCAELDLISASPKLLERTHLTPEHRRVNDLVAQWMRHAGLTPRQDAAGNIWGRREGRRPGLPALVLGSHLDTVPDAGSFDGMLGVVMAIAVVERIGDAIDDFDFAVEVVGFSDEEGTRFGTALLGSHPVAGHWDEEWWDLRDRDGITLFTAFKDFGLDPRRVGEAARAPESVVAYLEAHIEQGPYLEEAGQSLGYVTTIAGARRFRISVLGEARHAGGTPYERRRDALTGASEIVNSVERIARHDGTIATVGRLQVHPGAVNVIPGRVDLTLDLRAPTDVDRDATWTRILAGAQEICDRRRLRLDVFETHRAPAAPCAPWLQQAVINGIDSVDNGCDPGDRPLGLWSRAGHDAMAMARIADIGMLFLRCRDGISHNPDESVDPLDVARGLDAFEHTVRALARQRSVTEAGR